MIGRLTTSKDVDKILTTVSGNSNDDFPDLKT